jgi:hypothetical protein
MALRGGLMMKTNKNMGYFFIISVIALGLLASFSTGCSSQRTASIKEAQAESLAPQEPQ